MSKVKYEVVRVTRAMIEEVKAESDGVYCPEVPTWENMIVGSWEVRITGDGFVDWCGPYDTKREALEAKRGLKKSKAY